MKAHTPEHCQSSPQGECRDNNPACCDNPRQKQRLFDNSELSSASATQKQNHDKPHKPSASPQTGAVEQKFQIDSNEYTTYLVDYRYKGVTWSFDLKAASWEDAEARVRCLVNANVAGELVARVPIPETWYKRIRRWMGIN